MKCGLNVVVTTWISFGGKEDSHGRLLLHDSSEKRHGPVPLTIEVAIDHLD